jgi:hypothetical protein
MPTKMEVIQMAYIQKREHPNGNITYRARIRINGMPDNRPLLLPAPKPKSGRKKWKSKSVKPTFRRH